MAKALTKAISAATGCVNLGVKVYNNYMSLNWTTTPSVLLEMGYISNRKEDRCWPATTTATRWPRASSTACATTSEAVKGIK